MALDVLLDSTPTLTWSPSSVWASATGAILSPAGDEIATLSSRPERSGERYCNWYTNCGYDVTDPFACEEVYVCN